MTRQPWTIRQGASISQAYQLMREHDIRHLPVLAAGKLVGIVSERDLRLIENLPAGDRDEITVEDAMISDVYAVHDHEPLDAVVAEMAIHKYGSAVVLDRRGQVHGIFTTVDALDAFAELLRREAT